MPVGTLHTPPKPEAPHAQPTASRGGPATVRPVIRRVVQRGMLAALGLLVGLGGAEIVLRLSSRELGRYYIWPPYLRRVCKPMPKMMPGISGVSRFWVNSYGIRGDEFSDQQTYRVLAMGGSAMECLYLDQEESVSGRLQERLQKNVSSHVWVGSVGASGKRADDHVLHIEHLLPQYPRIDAVVVLVGVNDLLAALTEPALRRKTEDRYARLMRAFYAVPYREAGWSLRGSALWRFGRQMKYEYLY